MQPKPNGKVTNGHNGASQWGFGQVPAQGRPGHGAPERDALGLGAIDIPPYPGANPAGSWNTSYMPPPTSLGYGAYGEAAAAPHPVHVVTGEMNSPITVLARRRDGTAFEQPLVDIAQFSTETADFLIAKGLVTSRGNPFKIRVKGRLVVPRDLSTRRSPVPICFIVMGNHQAFENDNEVPNLEGYDYLQQFLADLGIASCSVDTNLANAFGSFITTRAEMLLATVELIRNSAPAAVRPKLDFSKMSFVGHSRGGEAVVLGALLFAARHPRGADGSANASGAVLSVASIAPTDIMNVFGFSAAGVSSPLSLGGSTRYLVLLGSHDGDVSPVRNNGFNLYDRAICTKTLVFGRGLTHNRFNTVWNECADYADADHLFVSENCRTRPGTFDQRIFAAEVHRNYAKFFVGALVRRTLLADASAENALRGLDIPSGAALGQPAGLQGPAASIQWAVEAGMRVDEFERAAVPRTTTGGVVESAGASRATVPHVSNAFIARAAGDKVRINLPRGTTVDSRTELTFRLTSLIPVTSDAAIERATLPDWEVRVVTAAGTTSARPSALDVRGIRAPNRPFFHQVHERDDDGHIIGTVNVTKNQFDTLSIPLSAFRIARGADVQAVEFEARGGTFPLILDSIAFV